jgi:hypothetical protein
VSNKAGSRRRLAAADSQGVDCAWPHAAYHMPYGVALRLRESRLSSLYQEDHPSFLSQLLGSEKPESFEVAAAAAEVPSEV